MFISILCCVLFLFDSQSICVKKPYKINKLQNSVITVSITVLIIYRCFSPMAFSAFTRFSLCCSLLLHFVEIFIFPDFRNCTINLFINKTEHKFTLKLNNIRIIH